MKRILYISRAGLPIDAAGIRTYYIGNVLENLGFEIHYIANRNVTKKESNSQYDRVIDNNGYLSDEEIHFQINKKIYSYLPKQKSGKIVAIFQIIELIKATKLFKRVCSYCEKESPYAIFLYNDTYALTKKLIPYCKRKNIKLFADVTEWYEKDRNKSISEKLVVNLTEKRIVKCDHRLDGIIGISNFFEDFYKAKGSNVVRIPPLMEIEKNLCINKHEYYENNSVLNFVYAGSPGGKDILIPFVKALQIVNSNTIRARLDVVGIDNNYFEKFDDINKNLESIGVFAHGRLSHDKTVEIVKKADFGILFRHNLRYAKAGFSTKFAECMSLGVPMICNSIGGCDLCIQHFENGVLTNTVKTEELVNVIEHLVSMSTADILRMKNNAYKYACDNFNPEVYGNAVKKMMGF